MVETTAYPPHPDSSPRSGALFSPVYWLEVLGFAAIYFACAWLGLLLNLVHGNVTPLWPPTGLSLAVLWILGIRLWPGVLLGAFAIELYTRVPLTVCLAVAVGNTLEAVTACHLLRQVAGFHGALERRRDVLALLLIAAAASTAVSASIGVTALCSTGTAPWTEFGHIVGVWWLGDAMSDLLVAPVILVWYERPRIRMSFERVIEFDFMLLFLTLASLTIFFELLSPTLPHYPFSFLMLPFAIWAAYRFQQHGAVTGAILVWIIAGWATAKGLGPFAEESITERFTLLQAFMGVYALCGLLVAAAVHERQQAEQEVRRSEQSLATTLQSIGDAVISTDTAGRILRMNPVAEYLTGWLAAEAAGRQLQDVFRIVDETTRQPAEDPVQKVLRRGLVVGLANHTLLLGRDGVERPIADSGAPIRDAQGNTLGVVLVFRDVTETRRGERVLRESEERLELALVGSRGGLWDIRFDPARPGVMPEQIYLSPLMKAMIGYADNEMPNLLAAWHARVLPEDLPRLQKTIQEHLEARTPFQEVEYRLRHKDGRTVWVHSRGKIRRDERGVPIRWTGVLWDITARKQAEDVVATREEQLRTLINSTPDFICFKDGEGRWIEANQFGLELFELTGVPYRGKTDEQLGAFSPFYREAMLACVKSDERSWQAREATRAEEAIPRRDGGEMVFDVIKVPLFNPDGGRKALVVIGRDITSRKRAEREHEHLLEREQAFRAEAERANRAKDEFLAVLSHELRTPLTPILGWTQMLLRGSPAPEDIRHGLSIIERSALAQSQIIKDLLDVSAAITGHLRLDVSSVGLPELIAAVIDSVALAAGARGITISQDLDPAVGPVAGDRNRLQQIIWNLMSNAVKFTPPGGRVEVALARADGRARITITDTGIGMAPEFLPSAFQRFRQADSSRTRRFGGLGLGLAIVRHLAELHGGTVSASSPGIGKGSTFTVELPLAAATAPAATPAPPPPPRDRRAAAPPPTNGSLQGRRVLLVEDDPDTLELLAKLIRHAGAETRTAGSVPAAIEALAAGWTPDVLLCDIGLPGQDGYELIRQVRSLPAERGGSIPAAAITGYAADVDRRTVLASGFQEYLTKPVDPDELLALIARLATAANAPSAPA